MHPELPRSFSALAWSNLAGPIGRATESGSRAIGGRVGAGAGPGEVGMLAAVQSLPFLLLSIPLGLLADRVSRQRLMLVAENLRALSLLALLAMVLSGRLSIAWLPASSMQPASG